MKIKISKILLVLSVCGLLYSCDKFFEVDLKEQMSTRKASPRSMLPKCSTGTHIVWMPAF